MSKSLSSIKNKDLKAEAIRRRINSGTMGLGYWAAVDALKAHHKVAAVTQRVAPSIVPELLISKDEAQGLLEKVKAAQHAAGVLDNWILRKS